MPSRSLRNESLPQTGPVQRAWDRALFVGLLLWTFLTLCFPLWDTDFWWHLKTGEIILHEGRVPQIDWFTYRDYDKPWIDLHWGFQVLIAFLYRLGGANLAILAKATVITSAVALAWKAGGRSLPAWLKTALWIVPVICISGRGNERPEMLTQLFLAFWLFAACQAERRPALVWVLPLVQLAWVNSHALFILGLVVGGAYLVDCVVRDFAGGRFGLAPPARFPSARALIWSGGLVVAASFANPYFEEGAVFPLVLYRKFSVDQPYYSQMIGEFHRPIDFLYQFGWRGVANIYLLAEAALWCVAAASFVLLVVRRRRWSVMRLLLFAGFSHLAWKATRNTNVFALVTGVVACENFGEALADAPEAAGGGARLLHRTWIMAAVVTALLVAVVTGAWNRIGGEDRPLGLGERPDWFIHGPARFAGRPGFPALAFVSHIGQAAVFEYHNGPERRVFMDPRLEVCTLQTFISFNDLLTMMYVSGFASEELPKAPAGQSPSAQGKAQPPAGERGASEPEEVPEVASARRWPEVLRQMSGGEMPSVILDSRFSIPQILSLLKMPGWRPVFADMSGVVFLSDEQADKLSLARATLPAALDERLRAAEAQIMRKLQEEKLKAGRPEGVK